MTAWRSAELETETRNKRTNINESHFPIVVGDVTTILSKYHANTLKGNLRDIVAGKFPAADRDEQGQD